MKLTPETWEDYGRLVEAKNKIGQIMETANEEKRTSDTIQKMIDIQNSFIWQSEEDQIKWSSSCKYISEGPFKSTNASGTVRKRYFFLFNEMIVISKPKGAKHVKVASIPIDKAMIWELPDSGSLPLLSFFPPSFLHT